MIMMNGTTAANLAHTTNINNNNPADTLNNNTNTNNVSTSNHANSNQNSTNYSHQDSSSSSLKNNILSKKIDETNDKIVNNNISKEQNQVPKLESSELEQSGVTKLEQNGNDHHHHIVESILNNHHQSASIQQQHPSITTTSVVTKENMNNITDQNSLTSSLSIISNTNTNNTTLNNHHNNTIIDNSSSSATNATRSTSPLTAEEAAAAAAAAAVAATYTQKEPDDEDGKLFVGGLSWDTNEQDLRDYFSKFGNVTGVSIKYDALSGNPRGFGFISFGSEESVERVLDRKLSPNGHVIKGKLVDPKRAKSRPICKKIFVGGVDPVLTEEEIKKYFSRYGKVDGIELPRDRQRNRRREFCFIIFETEEGADAASRQSKQVIGNKECDIKKAQPQPVAQQQKRLAQTAGLDANGTNLGKILSRARLVPAVANLASFSAHNGLSQLAAHHQEQLNSAAAIAAASNAWNGALGFYCYPGLSAQYSSALAQAAAAAEVASANSMANSSNHQIPGVSSTMVYPTVYSMTPSVAGSVATVQTPSGIIPISSTAPTANQPGNSISIDPQAAAAAYAAINPYGFALQTAGGTMTTTASEYYAAAAAAAAASGSGYYTTTGSNFQSPGAVHSHPGTISTPTGLVQVGTHIGSAAQLVDMVNSHHKSSAIAAAANASAQQAAAVAAAAAAAGVVPVNSYNKL